MNKRKILIGGGCGLVGKNLTTYFLNKGYDIVVIDNLSESSLIGLDERAKFYKLDISLDTKGLYDVFVKEMPDYCISCQAMAAEIASPWLKSRTYLDNFISLQNLINNCVIFGVEKILHFSSIAIFAGRNDPPFVEPSTPKPNDDYGLSKLMGEESLKLTKKQFGLNYSIIRAHNFQGPGMCLNGLRNFLGIAADKVRRNQKIPVFGEGDQSRQFTDVKFLCDPIEKLLHKDLEIVNLGADKCYKIIDVANIFKDIAHRHGYSWVDLVFLPERDEAKHAWMDHSLAKKELNFKDETNIEKLCFDIFEWVCKQPFHAPQKTIFEINRKLPDYWR